MGLFECFYCPKCQKRFSKKRGRRPVIDKQRREIVCQECAGSRASEPVQLVLDVLDDYDKADSATTGLKLIPKCPECKKPADCVQRLPMISSCGRDWRCCSCAFAARTDAFLGRNRYEFEDEREYITWAGFAYFLALRTWVEKEKRRIDREMNPKSEQQHRKPRPHDDKRQFDAETQPEIIENYEQHQDHQRKKDLIFAFKCGKCNLLFDDKDERRLPTVGNNSEVNCRSCCTDDRGKQETAQLILKLLKQPALASSRLVNIPIGAKLALPTCPGCKKPADCMDRLPMLLRCGHAWLCFDCLPPRNNLLKCALCPPDTNCPEITGYAVWTRYLYYLKAAVSRARGKRLFNASAEQNPMVINNSTNDVVVQGYAEPDEAGHSRPAKAPRTTITSDGAHIVAAPSVFKPPQIRLGATTSRRAKLRVASVAPAKTQSLPNLGANMPGATIESGPAFAGRWPPSEAPKLSALPSDIDAINRKRHKERRDATKSRPVGKKFVRTAGGQVEEDSANIFRLFWGDLGPEVSETLLAKAFQKYPSFVKAKVVRDGRSNKSKGFGFVSFKSQEDFERAKVQMDGGYVFGNRPIGLLASRKRKQKLGLMY